MQLDDGFHALQRKLRAFELVHEVDGNAVILEVAADIGQCPRAARDETPDGGFLGLEARRAEGRPDIVVHGRREARERRVERALGGGALADALRKADGLNVASEDHQRVGGVAPESRPVFTRVRARTQLDQVADPVEHGNRQSCDPRGVRLFRKHAAEQHRHVVRRGRRRQHLRRDATGQLLHKRAGVRQAGLAQQVDGIQFPQRIAQHHRHRHPSLGMTFQHLKEEPDARGRRRGALGIGAASRADPIQQLLQPGDAFGERRMWVRARDQPVDAHACIHSTLLIRKVRNHRRRAFRSRTRRRVACLPRTSRRNPRASHPPVPPSCGRARQTPRLRHRTAPHGGGWPA